MSSFDPNNPFYYSSFDRYDHRSAFDQHDCFNSHTQHHHEIKTSADHFHNQNQQMRRDEAHAVATREYSTRTLHDLDRIPLIKRLKKFFS